MRFWPLHSPAVYNTGFSLAIFARLDMLIVYLFIYGLVICHQ